MVTRLLVLLGIILFIEQNIHTFYAIPLFEGKRRRIGNLAGFIGSSMNHGQIPGYLVYQLCTKEELIITPLVLFYKEFVYNYIEQNHITLRTFTRNILSNILNEILPEILPTQESIQESINDVMYTPTQESIDDDVMYQNAIITLTELVNQRQNAVRSLDE